MSTRAMYTFSDGSGANHVYKHHDGYPYGKGGVGGLVWISKAIEYAWELPRFEADEFSAAFVAANKSPLQGGVRLVNKVHPWEFASDCEYWYQVRRWKDDDLWVDVFSVDWWENDRKEEHVMFGALSELLARERARLGD